jgi:hypothetical protein
MPDQPNNDPLQPKRRQPWGPYLAPAILIAAFGVSVGLLGGLTDPDSDGWEEHFRLGRAAMTVMPVMAALLAGMMGWQERRLKGLLLGGAAFGLAMLLPLLIWTYAPYTFSIVVRYLVGGTGKVWSGVIGALLGAAFGLIPFAVRICRQ